MNNKVKYTTLQKIIETIGIVITIVYVIYFVTSFESLPNKLPALLMPISGIIMYILISILQKYPTIWNVPVSTTPENEHQIYSILKTVIILIKVQMIAIFASISYYSLNSRNIPVYMNILYIGIPTVTMIITLIKVFRIEKESIIKSKKWNGKEPYGYYRCHCIFKITRDGSFCL